jgi:hypothetical protein
MQDRRRRIRRRHHHSRIRFVGFFDPFHGSLYRAAFRCSESNPTQRRAAFNVIATTMLAVMVFGLGLSSSASRGIGAEIATLLLAAILGWVVITVCRYYRQINPSQAKPHCRVRGR